MYLSKLHLQNWRSYADVTFNFKEPTEKRSVVLIGAMNGHGKTSVLISLYLGLFGRFGLRHCEGFSNFGGESDFKTYRDAVTKFRRNSANSDDPAVIDITLSPSWRDSNDENEVRVVAAGILQEKRSQSRAKHLRKWTSTSEGAFKKQVISTKTQSSLPTNGWNEIFSRLMSHRRSFLTANRHRSSSNHRGSRA